MFDVSLLFSNVSNYDIALKIRFRTFSRPFCFFFFLRLLVFLTLIDPENTSALSPLNLRKRINIRLIVVFITTDYLIFSIFGVPPP